MAQAKKKSSKPLAGVDRNAAPLYGVASTIDQMQPHDAILREFIADFSAASSLMRRLRKNLAASVGLSASEYSILLGLWYCQQRGDTNIRELADHLNVAAAHVTMELRELTARKLVNKVQSVTDRRALSIKLTPAGMALLGELAPLLAKVNVDLFAGVNYSEMVVVHRFFRRVIEQAPIAIRIAEQKSGHRARG